MYYILSWNNDNDEYSVIGDYKSVFQVYWRLKEDLKNTNPKTNRWIKCLNKDGLCIDLTKGMKYENFPEGYNGKILLKPAE